MKRAFILLVLLFLCGSFSARCRADGGIIRGRETDGPYLVTFYSPPEISPASSADLSVLVQDRSTREVILDAQVTFSFNAPAGASLAAGGGWCGPMKATFLAGATALEQSPAIPATHDHATNKLLYAAPVILPAHGIWHVETRVRRGPHAATMSCALPVTPPTQRLATLWPAFALPFFVAGTFWLHQSLRARRATARFIARHPA